MGGRWIVEIGEAKFSGGGREAKQSSNQEVEGIFFQIFFLVKIDFSRGDEEEKEKKKKRERERERSPTLLNSFFGLFVSVGGLLFSFIHLSFT